MKAARHRYDPTGAAVDRGQGVTGRSPQRLFVLKALVASLVVALFGRLWFLQVASGSQYAAAATANRTRDVVTSAVRGLVLDDQGRQVIANITAEVVTVDTTQLNHQKDHGRAVLARLAPLLSTPQRPITAQDLADKLKACDYKALVPGCNNGSPYQPVPVSTFSLGVSGDASTDPATVAARVAQIQERSDLFPGVAVQPQAVRSFPQGQLASQIVGYTDKVTADVLKDPRYTDVRDTDQVGRAGLEQQYDDQLRGIDGIQTLDVNRLGEVTGTAKVVPPTPGSDVVLNLDSKVQAASERALDDAITRIAPTFGKHPTDGAAVVLTTDGRVVALASHPGFDPSLFTGGITSSEYAQLNSKAAGQPLLNRASGQVYPPGSTWKAITGSALLGNGVVTPGSTQSCPPSFTIGQAVFGNFEGESFGSMDLHRAIAVSCDTFFYRYAYQQWLADGGYGQHLTGKAPGQKQIQVTEAKAFGFGSRTGLDLPTEAPGAIVDRATRAASYPLRKADYCKGAKTYAGTYRGRLDADNCTDGWRYNAGDLVLFAIGQGADINVTPLQMARAYGAIADGGTLYQPTLAKAVVTPAGRVEQTITPKAVGKVPLSTADIAYLQDAFYGVTHDSDGTARGVFADYPVPVYGKTGTAEVDKVDAAGNRIGSTDQSWFASFTKPSGGKPGYVVLVTVPDSQQGANVAAPAVKEIYDAIYGVDPTTNMRTPSKGAFGNASGTPPSYLPCFGTKVNRPAKACSATYAATNAPSQAQPTLTPSAGASGAAGALPDLSAALPPSRREDGKP